MHKLRMSIIVKQASVYKNRLKRLVHIFGRIKLCGLFLRFLDLCEGSRSHSVVSVEVILRHNFESLTCI